jgi:hypothetical protein
MERARARGAARYLAAQMSDARMDAITRSAAVALRFRADGQGIMLDTFVDGNRNGVRAVDIAGGVDWRLRSTARLEHLFPGVVIGVPADAVEGPIALGGSELLTFTPAGTATSGTVHVLGRDGSRFAVRILGATARIRVLRFDEAADRWVELL